MYIPQSDADEFWANRQSRIPILQAFGWPALWISMAGGVLFRIAGENIVWN